MAEVDSAAAAQVEKALKKNPGLSSTELYESAVGSNKKLGGLSVRQFHARYVLPVKRKLSPPRARHKKSSKARRRSGVKKAARARKSSKRSANRRAPSTPVISDIVEASLKDQRARLDAAATDAIQKAMKSGNLSDIDKVLRALGRATKDLSKV